MTDTYLFEGVYPCLEPSIFGLGPLGVVVRVVGALM